MDPCARILCSLLQFLAAPAEEQIAFCGDRLPERAGDMILLPDAPEDDDRRYAINRVAQEGNALIMLVGQFGDYWPIVSHLPENTLDQDDTIMNEILCLLELMVWFKGNDQAYNRFWGKDALRDSREWTLVRRLARQSLTQLGWPVTLPVMTFADLLYG